MPLNKLTIATAFLAAGLTWIGGGGLEAQSPAAMPAQTLASGDNPLQLKIDHTTISVANLDKEEAWYIKTLGFKEFARSGAATDDTQSRRLTIPGVFGVDLSYHKGSVRTATTGSGKPEQGFLHIVFKTGLIDAAYQQFTAQKIDMKAVKGKSGALATLLIHDPEGNEIEIQPLVDVPR